MLAFRNTTVTKDEILAQLEAHAKADEIVQGTYWENGKGCAVGCTIHSGDHIEYETRFGIPQAVARLEDCIFEGLPKATAKEWPLRFMCAVKPGADLSRVHWQFLYWLITDQTVNPGINHELVRSAVRQCADVIAAIVKTGKIDESAEGSALRSAAWSAAWSAARSASRSAEGSAARSAESAAWGAESAESAARSALRGAESAEGSALRSAAWSAASAASAAESAARSAARSVASAASAAESAARSVARSAARSAASAAWVRMADKLIELIADAPVPAGDSKDA